MKGLVLTEVHSNVTLTDVADPTPGPNQAVVRLRAAALNRRDYWITQDLYPGIVTPVILGSDGAGVVESIGSDVASFQPGDEVILYPARNWGPNPAAQGPDFTVLGMPDNGTFAERILVEGDQLVAKPTHLDWTETAAIPVAGITAYRALAVQGAAQAGQSLLITGIGGGVAVFALQLAVALGIRVVVTSSSAAKIERACEAGAAGGISYKDPEWSKQCLKTYGGFDVIIDGAGGPGFADLVRLLKPGGRIVSYGSTAGRPKDLDLFKIFWRQLSVAGSTLGSLDDFRALLQLMATHQIKPIVDEVHPLTEGPAAIAAMEHAAQFGKVALTIE